LVVLTLVAALAIAWSVGRRGEQPYEATALVVARHLNVSVQQLPRFGEAIFNSSSVSRLAVDEGNLGVDPENLIPGKVTLRPIQDTVLFEVRAVDQDPDQAAVLANVTAGAFIEELNKPGEGIGQFGLQSVAVPPTERRNTAIGAPTAAVVGVVGAAALALGLLWVLALLRPRVITAAQAAAVAGVPLAGTITLPGVKGDTSDPAAVTGLELTAWRVCQPAEGTLAIVGTPGDGSAAHEVRDLLGRVVNLRGAPRGLPEAREEVSRSASNQRGTRTAAAPAPQRPSHTPPDQALQIIDAESLDARSRVRNASPNDVRFVLVVEEGTKVSAVEQAAAQFLPGELESAVFVRRRGKRG
jgi:capsular polysaccharide biosynthesis protein